MIRFLARLSALATGTYLGLHLGWMLRGFLYVGAVGGWIALLILLHVYRFTSPQYIVWLLHP